jgi:serine/threonine-protein kinase
VEPQKIGRYEIKAELGRGGMATVYRAYDPRSDREVAIKVLPREMLHDAQFRVRFEREAKTIAMLEHPAIVPVYDFGEEDGQPYFVMRYMTGGSLSDRIKRGAFSVQEAASIFEHLAPALDEAHSKGIIHRDLKPGNILFDQYNESYISDFGIAKLSESQTNVTGSSIIGTPAYMSPEQAQGEGIDGRSDIYGMGVILFEMLTGTQPYHGDTPMSVVLKHITEPVPHILDVKPDLPPAIEQVIETAMAKDRDQRFPTVKALADALSAVARGESPDMKTIIEATRAMAPKGAAVQTKQTVSAKRGEEIPIPVPPESTAPPPKTRMWIGVGAAVLVVCLAAAGGLFLLRGHIPFLAAAPTQTLVVGLASPVAATQEISSTATSPAFTDTPLSATPLAVATAASPTAIPTATVPALPAQGGADLIAFLNGNNVWMVGVDGSGLRQLSTDGGTIGSKHDLQWTPDGQSVIYVNGKCIQMVNVVAKSLPSTLTCFVEAQYLDAFKISPDGKYVAISLNRQLFVVPYDLNALSKANSSAQLVAMKVCFRYHDLATEALVWSKDSQKIAVGVIGVGSGVDAGKQVDLVRVFDISGCPTTPAPILDTFPGTFFTMNGYHDQPVIPAFDWNGADLFLLNSLIRNKAYGYEYVYHMSTHQADQPLDPLGTGCCYTDMHWSPDGTYVVFGYQNYNLGSSSPTQLYYLNYGTISTGGTYQPIALPADFFQNPAEHPDAALRPVQ